MLHKGIQGNLEGESSNLESIKFEIQARPYSMETTALAHLFANPSSVIQNSNNHRNYFNNYDNHYKY